jgi:hypothetical protein
MPGGRGLIAVTVAAGAALCVAALAAAPAAHASQGSDMGPRGDYIQYVADPGETNRLTVDAFPVGLHLNDLGAIIRWAAPDPDLSECTAAVHDVACVDRFGGFHMAIQLGDGNDSFVNGSNWQTDDVQLGPGDDRAVDGGGRDSISGGDGNDVLEGGAGADILSDASGDNTFFARDGQADQILCGTGHDTVYADPQDALGAAPGGGPCDDVHIG